MAQRSVTKAVTEVQDVDVRHPIAHTCWNVAPSTVHMKIPVTGKSLKKYWFNLFHTWVHYTGYNGNTLYYKSEQIYKMISILQSQNWDCVVCQWFPGWLITVNKSVSSWRDIKAERPWLWGCPQFQTVRFNMGEWGKKCNTMKSVPTHHHYYKHSKYNHKQSKTQ